jgi:serine/threonine protein kinase
MDSAQVIARFEAERQALALMDHPHLAKVLDAGTTQSGRPFFVMELVKGLPITAFCDQAQLSPRQRLGLFVDVCQAVQHAHHKGIIHRDLKPSNVLVTLHDGKPLVKVIDFGIAKALGQSLTDKTLFTGFAQLVGTPLYMSPEQAALSNVDVDTRSDIYSLGVLLYELLTGTTPFDQERLRQAGYDEMRRIIREEEPPRPSTRLSTLGAAAQTVSLQRQSEPRRLRQLLRGELDWIVMKALDKERGRRYESASAFAADVQRYLADEPVLACPPSAGYRLRKFVRRHKGKLAVAALILVLSLTAAMVSTWQAVRATRAEQETSEALAQVTGEQARTQAALKAETAAKAQMAAALDALTEDVVETMFARQPQLEESEKDFLRKVLGLYEAVTPQLDPTPEARLLQAKGYFKVARLRQLLGEQKKAEAAYRKAQLLLEQLADAFPGVADYRVKLATTCNNLGVVLTELGQEAEAEKVFRQALALRQKLADDSPKVLVYRRDLATSCNDLSVLLRMQKKYAEAEQACRQAVELEEKLVAEAGAAYHKVLARGRTSLGDLLREQGKYAAAEKLYRLALEVQQKYLAESPAVPWLRRELADSYHGLGIVLTELKQETEAEKLFRQAVALRQKLTDDFPKVLRYRRELAHTYHDLGNFLQRQGKAADAEEAFRQALELRKKVVAEAGAVARYRQELAATYGNLAGLLAVNRPKDAEAALHEALALWKQLAADFPKVADYHNELAGTLGKLALLHKQRGESAAALALLEEAGPHHQVALGAGPKNPKYRLYYRNNLVTLAQCHFRLADHARLAAAADELARLAYDPANDIFLAVCCLCTCGQLAYRDAPLDEAGRKELADSYADRAMALLQQAVACGFNNVAQLHKNPDLAPLRVRPEFWKLVAAVEGKTKK